MVAVSTMEERYWAKVDVLGPDDCWLWMGANTGSKAGRHGLLWDGTYRPSGRPRFVKAHRLAWTLAYGDPGDLQVLHRCDNPPCQNPRHLVLGSNADNIRDKVERGRCAPGDDRLGRFRRRLTDEQVAEIRADGAPRYGDQTRLGRQYGVSAEQIRRILNGTRR